MASKSDRLGPIPENMASPREIETAEPLSLKGGQDPEAPATPAPSNWNELVRSSLSDTTSEFKDINSIISFLSVQPIIIDQYPIKVMGLNSMGLANGCSTGELEKISEEGWKAMTAHRFPDIFCCIQEDRIPDLEGESRTQRGFRPWRTLYTEILAVSESDETEAALKVILCSHDFRYEDDTLMSLTCLLYYELLLSTLAGTKRLALYFLAAYDSPLIQEAIISDDTFFSLTDVMLQSSITPNYVKAYRKWHKSTQSVLCRFMQGSISDSATMEELCMSARVRSQNWSKLFVEVCRKGYIDTLKLFLKLSNEGTITSDPSAHESRCLRVALQEQKSEVVRLLLEDGRVNPLCIHLSLITQMGFTVENRTFEELLSGSATLDTELLECLLDKNLVNILNKRPSFSRKAFMKGLRMYLQSKDVRPPVRVVSMVIITGDREIVELFLTDGRAEMNRVSWGFGSHTGYLISPEIIKLFLGDPRFDPTLYVNEIRHVIEKSGDEELAKALVSHPSFEPSEHTPNTSFLRETLRAMAVTNREGALAYIKEITAGVYEILEEDTKH